MLANNMNITKISLRQLPEVVDDVHWLNYRDNLLQKYDPSKIHGNSRQNCVMFDSECNNFVGSMHFAFEYHRPFRITPSIIWLQILHGIGLAINRNTGSMRDRCVKHDGKLLLDIVDNSLKCGKEDNNWDGVIDGWIQKIGANLIDGLSEKIILNLSDTGRVERAAFGVAIMYSFKEYFDYQASTLCGIPSIELAGTSEDWQEIIEKAILLTTYFELEEWRDALIPTLRKMQSGSAGEVDKEFWNNMYKYKSASGGDIITGWVVDLFPYLEISIDCMDLERKEQVRNWSFTDRKRHVHLGNFPNGITVVPVKWKYLRTTYEMSLEAGFVGVGKYDGGVISPSIGWSIRDREVG